MRRSNKTILETIKPLMEKKLKYSLKNVNGGFSDGVSIDQGTGVDADKIFVSVNIYGGGKTKRHFYTPPKEIQDLLNARLAALQNNDPVSEEIEQEINKYFTTIKKAVGIKIAKLLQDFDTKSKTVIHQTVISINNTYSTETTIDDIPDEPQQNKAPERTQHKSPTQPLAVANTKNKQNNQ